MSEPAVFTATIRSYIERQRCGCEVRVWHAMYFKRWPGCIDIAGEELFNDWPTAIEYVCGTLKASNRARS